MTKLEMVLGSLLLLATLLFVGQTCSISAHEAAVNVAVEQAKSAEVAALTLRERLAEAHASTDSLRQADEEMSRAVAYTVAALRDGLAIGREQLKVSRQQADSLANVALANDTSAVIRQLVASHRAVVVVLTSQLKIEETRAALFMNRVDTLEDLVLAQANELTSAYVSLAGERAVAEALTSALSLARNPPWWPRLKYGVTKIGLGVVLGVAATSLLGG